MQNNDDDQEDESKFIEKVPTNAIWMWKIHLNREL